MAILTSFTPVEYNKAENKFLLDNLGKPTIVALNQPLHSDIVPFRVREVLDRVNELEQLRIHDGMGWEGIEALKDKIQSYLTLSEKWERDWERFGKNEARVPRLPTMNTFDAKNKHHYGGPGSDSGQVRTYYDKNGERQKFEVSLNPMYAREDEVWTPPTVQAPIIEAPKDILEEADKHRIECRLCNHTESYKEGSAASYRAARARMAGHMKKTTKDVDLHREYYLNVFGS